MIKDDLLNYVRYERDEILKEIESLDKLPEEVLIEKGLILKDLILHHKSDQDYLFTLELNNSRLKPGDTAIITSINKSYKVTIVENLNTEITIESAIKLDLEIGQSANLKIEIPQLLDPIISLYDQIKEGTPGYAFLEILFGQKDLPKLSKFRKPIDQNLIQESLNDQRLSKTQNKIINELSELPYLKAIQGPPGTGKSFTIAKVVELYHKANKRILIIGHTHQAVNNCLSSIYQLNQNIELIKIGNDLKASSLPEDVLKIQFNDYHSKLKKNKIKDTAVIGMTIYSAIIHLGLRNTSLNPHLVIVDEAGQIPLYIGSLLGSFGASTNLFFGDDKQMPPIFHPSLQSNELSLSVFQQLRKYNSNLIDFLDISYRMNDQLTDFISKNFYLDESNSPLLKVSDLTRKNRLNLNFQASIPDELLPEPSLVNIKNTSSNTTSKQENQDEAIQIAELINSLHKCSYDLSKIAVVTPFRKQVTKIKSELSKVNLSENILVDTVERIQGITVDIIIVSLVSTDPVFIKKYKDFIYSKNRLNVAISRARLKAIIFGDIEPILNNNETI